jgi:hypothetical protein
LGLGKWKPIVRRVEGWQFAANRRKIVRFSKAPVGFAIDLVRVTHMKAIVAKGIAERGGNSIRHCRQFQKLDVCEKERRADASVLRNLDCESPPTF